MLIEWQRLIAAIHDAPVQCVVVVTGGGSSAISDLLIVPGGSRTLLDAAVPYSAAALIHWLGGKQPEQFCSEETALAMAAVALERADRLAAEVPPDDAGRRLVGISCTAALVSDRPKRGDHRSHIALQTANESIAITLSLSKGARDRPGEERVVGHLILQQLARCGGLHEIPALELLPGESIVEHRRVGEPLLVDLRAGRRKLVWAVPGGTLCAALPDQTPLPRGVLCGAFNPLHRGHAELRQVAEQILGGPVYYELSLRNVDKPPLDYLTIDSRRQQFTEQPLALTSAPTFAEKADALPGLTFVVGYDTAERIVQPRYYGDSATALHGALARIRDRGCRFLVAGRKQGDEFRTLADLPLPAEFAGLFQPIPPDSFRVDLSSTELRRQGSESGRPDSSG